MDFRKGLKIAIAGGGPAGASLAIRLRAAGFEVVLIEKEKFPRQKLCGEFISPECLPHFEKLGILEEMLAAGGDPIRETVFFGLKGRWVSVKSDWFLSGSQALGLSRAKMDHLMIEKARDAGAVVLENTCANGLIYENGAIAGLKLKGPEGKTGELMAGLFIDATGRAKALARLSEKRRAFLNKPIAKPAYIAFKSHLRNAAIEKGKCEIYFFRGGYGGLSRIEGKEANHCFLIEGRIAKAFENDPDRIWKELIFANRRAKAAMAGAEKVFDWLAVSVDGFGAKNLNPEKNLIAIGDAGAFIDPFTGSGMLMALESSEILEKAITGCFGNTEGLAASYISLHNKKFSGRLMLTSILRRATSMPSFAEILIRGLNLSNSALEFLAKATRAHRAENSG